MYRVAGHAARGTAKLHLTTCLETIAARPASGLSHRGLLDGGAAERRPRFEWSPLRYESTSSRTVSSKYEEDKKHSMVTSEQVSSFLDQGYLVIEDFWSERELSAIRRQLEHLQERGRLANVATMGDGKTHTDVPRNLQLCPLSPEANLFCSLPFAPKVSATLSDLLLPADTTASSSQVNQTQTAASPTGTDAVVCYLSQVFWKPAKHGMGTSWHQDNQYFQVSDCQHCTAMWSAVHDATADNGALRVIPQGWKRGLLSHVRDGHSDHHVTCRDQVDESQAVTLEVKAGGVIFFNYLTPHATGGNKTDKPRAGVAYHFLPKSQRRERQFPLPPDAAWVTPVVWDANGCCYGDTEYASTKRFESDVDTLMS